MLIVWIVLGAIGLAAVFLFWSAVRLNQIEQKYPWLHPPNDDDGCCLIEEDDPDGEYTR